MTRKEAVKQAIERGDIKELLELAEGHPCACMGETDNEPLCVCKMNSKQVREAFSYFALKRGKLLPLQKDALA